MSELTKLYRKITGRIDLPFLVFLLTLSSNKIYLKLFALLLIFALRPRFKLLFNKDLPMFYPLIILLSTAQFLFFGFDFSSERIVVFLVGVLYWFMCYAFTYQAWLFVKESDFLKLDTTIKTYVFINFAVCLVNYFSICIETRTLLPFLLTEGEYGASTGDHITGIFGRPSYINAIVNSLFALYFIHRKELKLFSLTTFFTLLSFANIINLIFIAALCIYLVIAGDTRKRIFIVLNILLCFLIYVFVSPDNYNYIRKTIGLSVKAEKEIMPDVVIAKKGDTSAAAHLPRSIKYVNDSSAARQKILMYDRDALFTRDYSSYKTYFPVDIKSSPGKVIAIKQTLGFLKANPGYAFVGAGIGNFSSRLAYQFSGRDSSRLFSKLPRYCSGYYFQNHLLIYDSMRQLPDEYHSIKHFPNNFLSQLLGEYGLIGLFLFLGGYVLFFYKRCGRNKSFFFILVFCIAGYLMLDYFFEFFNVMLIAEMLLYIEIKRKQETETAPAS